MYFAFTQEQELFRATMRRFSREVLLPKYAHWDKTGENLAPMMLRMGELGLTALRLSDSYGGSGADFVTCGIAVEELARGDFNCAGVVVGTMVSGCIVEKYASVDVREEYLPLLSGGKRYLAVALTEPHCGSDAAALSTRAVRDGNQFVLNGEKSSISLYGDVAAILVWTTIDPTLGSRGITIFAVPIDAPGLGISYFNDIGVKCAKRSALHLDGVRVPATNMIGEAGHGFRLMMKQFDYARALIALQAIGAAEQALDETVAYTRTRTAFGQPVARFQGVAFPIVEAATHLEAARLHAYKALWLCDRGLPHLKESAMAKRWGVRLAFDTIHRLLLLQGHRAYSDDYLFGQRLRDVLGQEIGDGTAEIMNLIIAREMLS